jgi:hypothetical protein
MKPGQKDKPQEGKNYKWKEVSSQKNTLCSSSSDMDTSETAHRDDDEVGDTEYGHRFVKFLENRKDDEIRFWCT